MTMRKKRRYDHDQIHTKVRNMFLRMGFPVPDEAMSRRIIVHGEHGEILEERVIGLKTKDEERLSAAEDLANP